MALKEIIVQTQANLRADAASAEAVFSVDSRQVENLRSEAKIRQFSLTVDEPPNLGGSDAGPNPVELVRRRWRHARRSHTALTRQRSASRSIASRSSSMAFSTCGDFSLSTNECVRVSRGCKEP